MRKLAMLVVATTLATTFAGAGAADRSHHKHAANPPKASSAQPVENPASRLPVPADTFRA
jgi:hypothetical protein